MNKVNLTLITFLCFWIQLTTIQSSRAQAITDSVPVWLKDRGKGIPTSLFGTYIEKGDLIFYPFYEYYYEKKEPYTPSDFGYNSETEYEAKFSAHEQLIYFGYGLSDWMMAEMEASVIQARQYKAANDPSGFPPVYKERGVETVEGQLRWRYWKETSKKPELFSYATFVLPTQGDHKIIGTAGWDLKIGSGLIKGYKWGTLNMNVSLQYNTDSKIYEFGGFTVEYLKKLSNTFRFYLGVEGIPDATEFIVDLQFHLRPWMFLRVNNAFGISSGANDIAPEVGIVMYLNKLRKR